MGQYYIPTIMGKRYGVRATFYSHDYDNGLKLMEHSWIGNNFVGAVLTEIQDHPMRVAWIGDYSDSPYPEDGENIGREPYQRKLTKAQFMKIYGQAWGNVNKKRPEFLVLDDDIQWYLVNHDRKSYIDLNKYIKHNQYKPSWDYSECTWCVHPLPLLTACGNGRGGGDYRDDNDYDKIGTWAFDLIELTNALPEGYAEEMYSFKEE